MEKHHGEAVQDPMVSIVMPVYNVEMFVREAVRSVIAQTITDWELIIIDDCSKDNSYQAALEVAQNDSRISVWRNEVNSGVARTRNTGIRKSRGQYIAFLDSDDAWYPEKLQRQLAKIEEAKADIVYCSYAIVDANGAKVKDDYLVPEHTTFDELLKENVILCSAMLIRADVVKEIEFNTEFYHEDFVLALDILRAGYSAAGCADVLMRWRYIQNSRSFNKLKSAKNRWRVYRKYLKLSLGKSMMVFLHYGLAGIKKYS